MATKTLILTPAEMGELLARVLNTHVMRTPVRVSGIEQRSDRQFVVNLNDVEAEDGE